jgi:glyoxylate utilization-related uncharacterized protein
MNSQSQIEERINYWKKKGLKCEVSITPTGESWSSDDHQTDEVIIPWEGELELSLQGKTFRSTIGEEIIIPAGEPHTFKSVAKVASRLYWLYGYEHEEGVTRTRVSN